MTDRRARLATFAAGALVAAAAIAVATSWGPQDGNVPKAVGPSVVEAGESADEPNQLWTCGMHPQVIQDKPGFCPICGMALTPLNADVGDDASASGASGAGPIVSIDPVVVQNMGVRTAPVVVGPLRATVRAVGIVAEAEPNRHDVNLRVSGWIERLYADTEGMHLQAGDPLFELYSPDLQVAIEELIGARAAGGPSNPLYLAAERKLLSLGLTKEQIGRLSALERAPRTVTFYSPSDGHLIEKGVVEGAAVQAGDRVMRIVDHSTLWLDARVFEQDLPFVGIGTSMRATVDGLPGREFDGTVAFIHPHLDMMTRAAMVRLVIPNPSLELRPGMYATVQLTTELMPDAVLVPREAILDSGTRQLAFVVRTEGHFEPRQLSLGPQSDGGMVQVLSGLSPGETVVTSGQFLLDAESRLKEAIAKMLAARRGAAHDQHHH